MNNINQILAESLKETTDRLLGPLQNIVKQYPDHIDAKLVLGHYLYRLGYLKSAYEVLQAATIQAPRNAKLLNLTGVVLKTLGKNEEAIAHLKEALHCDPLYSAARFNMANALRASHNNIGAINQYKQVIQKEPSFADAYTNLIGCLLEENDLAQAEYFAGLYLEANSSDWRAYFYRAEVMRKKEETKQAIDLYTRAVKLNPSASELHNNLATCLVDVGLDEEAEIHYTSAVDQSSREWIYLLARGSFYLSKKCYHQAHKDLNEAYLLRPKEIKLLNALGRLYSELQDTNRAIEYFRKATALSPKDLQALSNLGLCLRDTNQLDLAATCLRSALETRPDHPYILGHLLFNQLRACEWADYKWLIQELKEKIAAGVPVATPFVAIIAVDDPWLHRRTSELYWTKEFEKKSLSNEFQNPALRRCKLNNRRKIGYFSADFYDHATTYLITEVFEKHDTKRYETVAFSFAKNKQSPLGERLKNAFTHYIDVSEWTDQQVVQHARNLQIDIAVDLKGYTMGARPKLFTTGVAPIQINFLGFPGTLGNPSVQYLLADSTVIPPASRGYYTEEVLYLDPCYQPNDSNRPRPPVSKTRDDHGLKNEAFVLCCFNNSYKLTPTIFEVWLNVLMSRSHTILWLLADNVHAARNLKSYAARMGVDPERLVFAPRCDFQSHLERHHHADLFVDTYPCCAHTTASDCLWMGLPILTLQGSSMASRVASSLLKALDLDQLITSTLQSYTERLFQLVDNPEMVLNYRSQLETSSKKNGLFSGELYCKKLELTYDELLDRHPQTSMDKAQNV